MEQRSGPPTGQGVAVLDQDATQYVLAVKFDGKRVIHLTGTTVDRTSSTILRRGRVLELVDEAGS